MLFGHPLDIGSQKLLLSGVSLANGTGTFFLTIPASMSGRTGYIEAACDGPQGWRDSNALMLNIQ